MDRDFLLNIVTPFGLLVHSKVEEVYVPGSQGDFCVFPGHAPLFSLLRIGELWYRRNNKIHFVAINHGFAEVMPSKTTILTDTAEFAENIDLERARSSMARAEEKLKTIPRDDPDYSQEMESLERAKLRIRVAQKGSRI